VAKPRAKVFGITGRMITPHFDRQWAFRCEK